MLFELSMIHLRRIGRICVTSAALLFLATLSASPSQARELSALPFFAAAFSEAQAASSASPAQSGAPATSTSQNSQAEQNPPNVPQPQSAQTEAQKKNDRMFFVMPNFLTVRNEAEVKPLTWKGKFKITADGAFDPYEFFTAGIIAGIRQAENAYPGFGQGFVGYAKRYGTAFADEVDGNMMVGAVFPSILKTDPRYYQMGTGKFMHRFGYALSRIFITRKDSGGSTLNLSEPLGNGVAAGIANLYYPAADRSFTSSLNGWGLQMAIDGLGNELKEFWPDIHRAMERGRHHHAESADAPTTTP